MSAIDFEAIELRKNERTEAITKRQQELSNYLNQLNAERENTIAQLNACVGAIQQINEDYAWVTQYLEKQKEDDALAQAIADEKRQLQEESERINSQLAIYDPPRDLVSIPASPNGKSPVGEKE